LLLAILLDQTRARRKRAAHDLSLSFGGLLRGTGTVWSGCQPGLACKGGAESWLAGFPVDWLVQSDKAVYTLIFAGVWQGLLCLALFLAGLRSVDATWSRPRRSMARDRGGCIAVCCCRPFGRFLFTVFVILLRSAITSFDLVGR